MQRRLCDWVTRNRIRAVRYTTDMAPASQPPTTTTLRAFLVTALAARGGSARRGDRSEREIFGLSSQCCREPWEPRTAEVPVMAATGGMTVPAIVARKG